MALVLLVGLLCLYAAYERLNGALDASAWLALLLLLTVWAYRSAWAAGFVYEDAPWLPTLGGPVLPGLATITYAPWMAAQFVGRGAPWAFHGVLLLVHLLNGLLLYRLVCVWASSRAALLTAGLFWLHPINTEAVAYLSGGRESLVLLWLLLALTAGTMRAPFLWALLSVGLCTALAVLSKSSGVVAVALVPLGLAILAPAFARRAAPWCVGVGLLLAIPAAAYVLHLEASEHILYVGIRGWVPYAAHTSAALVRYLALLVVPVGFTVDHDWLAGNPLWPTLSLGLVGAVALVAMTHPTRLSLVVAWIGLALAPRFVIQQADILNEHQVLVPLVAVWVLIGVSVDRALQPAPVDLVLGPGDGSVTLGGVHV